MILHLISSSVFVNYIISQFEKVNKDNNRYYFVGSTTIDKNKLPYDAKINFILKNSPEYFSLIDNLDKYNGLILHSLHPSFYKFVLNAPKSLKITWIFFGAEIYSTFKEFKSKILLPKTIQFTRGTKDYYIELFKPFYRKLIGRKTNESYIKACLKRIDFFALSQKSTHQFIINNKLSNAEFVDFSYYSIDETVGTELFNKKVAGDNILVGNSASLSNNHLDIFEVLKNAGISDKNIFVPLSYGKPYLVKKVINEGERIFGLQFKPIVDFMPKKDYNTLILDCGYIIMNHLRPQARGNIITGLWLGAKVFLNEGTILFDEFREKGIIISPISEIKENPEMAFKKLSNSDIENNRKILLDLYNFESILKRTQNLVNRLLNKKGS